MKPYSPTTDCFLANRRHDESVEDFARNMEIRWREVLATEHALSDSYVRLRVKLNALDTPPGLTVEQMWQHTEDKLDALIAENKKLARVAERRAELVKIYKARAENLP